MITHMSARWTSEDLVPCILHEWNIAVLYGMFLKASFLYVTQSILFGFYLRDSRMRYWREQSKLIQVRLTWETFMSTLVTSKAPFEI